MEPTIQGLRNFGRWLKAHRCDQRFWSQELYDWFSQNVGFPEGKTLTQERLCDFIAEATGDEDFRKFKNQIKSMEAWPKINTLDDTRVKMLKLNTAYGLAKSKFLTLDGKRIDNPCVFIDVIQGQIDPFHSA